MKKLYYLMLSSLMVAAMIFSPQSAQATCKSTTGMDFSYANKCKTYTFEAKAFTSGCLKYQWKILSSSATLATIDGRVISYTFSANGSYYARLQVTDTCNSCDTVIYKNISVNCNTCNWASLNPTLYVSNANSSNCMKYVFASSNLNDTCIKYSWTVDGKAVSSYPGQPRYMMDSFVSTGNHTVCLHLVNSCKSCDTSICTTVSVKNCAKCNWSGMDFSYSNKCRTYTFEGKSTTSGCVKYQFYVYNGTSLTTLSPGRVVSYTFPATGSYTVKMTAYDTCHGCDTFIYKTLTIDCNPCGLNPEFSWKADCRKVKFLANGSSLSGVYYYWSFGDGSTGSGMDPTHTYVKNGVYKVCLTMAWKDPNTGDYCKKQVCKEIKVQCGEPCNIKGDFSFYNKGGGLIKFYATSNTGVYYEWDFGDGTTGSGKDPSHQYKKAGTYTVCVKISDKTRKCYVKICKKVVIEEPCHLKGDFTWTKTSTGAIKFLAISNDGYYYSWDFGDGSTGTGKDPSHTYKAGTYTVCVTIYSKNNTRCHIKICKTIVIGGTTARCNWAALGANFGYSIKCPNLNLEAKNLDNGSPCIKYYWAITPYGTTQTTTFKGRTQSITFNSTGYFNVCLKLYDTCKKCDTTICKWVYINCSKCNFGWAKIASYVKCNVVSLEIPMPSTNSGCYKYEWSIAGSATSNGRVASYTFTKNGTYTICAKIVDTCHNCDTAICTTVTIDCLKCNWKAKYPNFVTYSSYVNCKTITAGLNTSSYPCIKEYWSLAGGAWHTGSPISLTVDKNGTYSLCLKLVDTCNQCDTTICKDITVNCSPCSWYTLKPAIYVANKCRKYTFYSTALNNNDTCIKYSWYVDGTLTGTGRYLVDSFTATGTYKICLKLVNTCYKCDTTICQDVKVDCTPCTTAASFKIDSVSTAGIVYVTNTSTGGYYYKWTFGDSSDSYDKNPVKHGYSASGTYTICLYVYDSLKTCSTYYCYTVKVSKTRSAASIDNLNITVPVHVYPNPAESSFVITTAQTGTYQVMDLNGKLVTSGSLANSTSVNSSTWREGVYLIRVETAEGVGTTRVVITK